MVGQELRKIAGVFIYDIYEVRYLDYYVLYILLENNVLRKYWN